MIYYSTHLFLILLYSSHAPLYFGSIYIYLSIIVRTATLVVFRLADIASDIRPHRIAKRSIISMCRNRSIISRCGNRSIISRCRNRSIILRCGLALVTVRSHQLPIDLAQQTEFCLLPNLSEECKCDPNLVWIDKIQKRFLHV